jgi:serine/threonine protein kinase
VTPSERWRRIEEIFQSALDTPEEQRAARVETLCGGDADLRLEVESLLARDDQDRDVDESPVISGIIEGTAASLFDDEAPPDAMVGAELGNYRIIREIGRGGMGAVYLAVRADRTFEKQVAIKLVKRGTDTDAILQRFWYERRILAALEHPYIARLVDGGTSPDGRPYFVMEYIDGRPLDAYVRAHDLTILQRCELFRKICEAVSYAHRNLIIHRDLKPANILVTADGTPKLLDFGIARLLSIDAGQHTIAGPPSVHALTPDFASPEQMRGEAVTTATDVYTLGATLSSILPFEDPVPPDLLTIVGKAMRDEIDQRYASVADLSEDVRRYLSGLPILAREQTFAYQVGKFVRRHRGGVAIFLAASLLVLCGVAAIVWESHRADIQRREAEQRLSQAVDMADRNLKEVNDSIASLPGTTEARRRLVRSTLDYLDLLSKDSGENPRVLSAMATAYVRVGEVLGNPDFPNLGDLDGALATYRKAIGVIHRLLDAAPRDLRVLNLASVAHEGAGNVLIPLGQHGEAHEEYRRAIELADRALALDPDDANLQYQSLDAHYALDMSLYSPQPAVAEQDANHQLPLALKLASAHPDDLEKVNKLSEFYALLGTTAGRQNRLREALDRFRKAAEVREAIYQKNPRNTRIQRSLMIGYGHVGDVLGSPFTGCLGDYRGALEYYGKAAAIAEEMRGADPSDRRAGFDVAMIWTRIGATTQASGDARQSNLELDRAIAQFESLMAASPGNASYAYGAALAYEYRGRNLWLLGDRISALSWYRKSLSLVNRQLAARTVDPTARAQQMADEGPIATLLALSGERTAAMRMVEELVKDADSTEDRRNDLHLAQAWDWYGQTYEALHDDEKAAAGYSKSAEAWKSLLGQAVIPPYEAQLEVALHKAAQCRRRLGRAGQAP